MTYSRQWAGVGGEGSVGRTGFVAEHGLWTDRQAAAAEQVEAALDEIDLVRLVFCDPHGLARSKTLTAGTFRSVLRDGMDFSPGPFIFDTGHAVAVDFIADPGVGVAEVLGAGDFVVVPDPLTFQVLPHPGRRSAWVLGDEFLRDGTRHPLSARDVLRRVRDRYAARSLTPVIGLEVEWYLTRRLEGPPGNAGNGFGLQGAAPEVEAMNAGYQFNLDTSYDSVAAVTDPLAVQLMDLGLPLRTMEHESGPGQVETTFDPMLALDAADAMLLFRTLVKQVCARRGHHASFMSLPALDGFDPSGWHVHQSVLDAGTGRNVFSPGDGVSDSLSVEGKGYVEGLLARARDFCLLSVPTVNGYRRLGPGYSLSPTRIGWSVEDRTAMVRLLGGGQSAHVENRVGEPCANPYLAIAAQLHAGLEGLGNGTTAPTSADSPQTLPQSLGEALAEFRDGDGAADLLGGPLTSCLIKIKESEVARFESWCAAEGHPGDAVTGWEHREYFASY
ncbi:glutamine synthetase [Actinomadura soli]|uniref:Glutamine synthetase n=1 Tax=Actinomadura soli TaxID=2508997 RepID=A0A5C4J5A5_9ACTN|nr:glutamine synthetase family protein [Actinomadura soli]TMQ92010.1 glutamine synthetase [Actinomadura soli]